MRYLADQEIATTAGSRRPQHRHRARARRARRLARLRPHSLRQPHSRALGHGRHREASAPPAAPTSKPCGATTASSFAFPRPTQPPDIDRFLLEPAEAADLVLRQLGSTALFAAKFRESAARALLLPRRRADGRTPLWQQRKRAYDLLSVASPLPVLPHPA